MEKTFDIKPKICKICKDSFVPFKSTDRVCGYTCAIADKKVRETGLKAPKRKRIAAFSTKRKEENKKYAELRADYLANNEICEVDAPDCTDRATEVHHSKGRGKYLLDHGSWYRTCRACHDYIHHTSEGIKWGKEKGFIKNRL